MNKETTEAYIIQHNVNMKKKLQILLILQQLRFLKVIISGER